MNIRRIIREEINNDLLMEGKLNDMFKKFNMTQIKKELKERLDIDETSTKMEVAKKLIKYSYKLNLKLLKYELGAILGGFIFYFISVEEERSYCERQFFNPLKAKWEDLYSNRRPSVSFRWYKRRN